MLRVLIVGDIRLYREGVALLLEREMGVRAAATFDDVDHAIDGYRELRPDVVLLDAAAGDPIPAVRMLVSAEPEMRIVVLGVAETASEVIAYAEAGVAGYVTREAGKDVLCDALKLVAEGGTLCSPQIAGALLKRIAFLSSLHAQGPDPSSLTRRERVIAELMREGLSNKEIAHRLCIEVATVKNHVHRILQKLGVRRRGEVAASLRA